MPKMSIIDYLFLATESPEFPKHVAGLSVFEKPKGNTRDFLDKLEGRFRSADPVAPFNFRIKERPYRMPEWSVEKDVDLDYHFRRSVLPSPGTADQLNALVARLHANMLDRTQPLWELHIIEGLENGGFALYSKFHHALADGATINRWLLKCMSADPDDRSVVPVWAVGSRSKGDRDKRVDVLKQFNTQAQGIFKQIAAVPDLYKLAARLQMSAMRGPEEGLAIPFAAPKTRFNQRIGSARRIASGAISLKKTKKIGRAFDASVNDIVLSICGAGIYRYLKEHDELPKAPIVASVPVDLRKKGDTTEGNHVAMVAVKLKMKELGPIERLIQTRDDMNETKHVFSGFSREATQDQTILWATLGQAIESLKLESVVGPIGNVVISNVPGPSNPLYLRGVEMISSSPVSTVGATIALNITVYSYNGTIYFGLISGRETVPDLQLLADYIIEAFDDVKKAAKKELKENKARKKKGRKKKNKTTNKLKENSSLFVN